MMKPTFCVMRDSGPLGVWQVVLADVCREAVIRYFEDWAKCPLTEYELGCLDIPEAFQVQNSGGILYRVVSGKYVPAP